MVTGQHYKKLCDIARSQKVNVKVLAKAVLEAYADGTEVKVAPATVRTNRTVENVRAHFLTHGPQTIEQLSVIGVSKHTLRMVVKALCARGELLSDVDSDPGKLGRPAFVYVPVPSKINATAALVDAAAAIETRRQ